MADKKTQSQQDVAQEQSEKLDHMAEVDPELLFKATTVFPFRFFPCTVLLNRIKLSIIDHYFFFAQEQHTVLISDIVRVDLEEAFFLATIKILDKSLNTKELQVSHLWRSDAQRLRRLIDGLQIAERQGIDLSQVHADELVLQVERLGTTKS